MLNAEKEKERKKRFPTNVQRNSTFTIITTTRTTTTTMAITIQNICIKRKFLYKVTLYTQYFMLFMCTIVCVVVVVVVDIGSLLIVN